MFVRQGLHLVESALNPATADRNPTHGAGSAARTNKGPERPPGRSPLLQGVLQIVPRRLRDSALARKLAGACKVKGHENARRAPRMRRDVPKHLNAP